MKTSIKYLALNRCKMQPLAKAIMGKPGIEKLGFLRLLIILFISIPILSYSQDKAEFTASAGANTNDSANPGYYIGVGAYGMQNKYAGFQMDLQYNRYRVEAYKLEFITATYSFRFPVKKFVFNPGIQIGYLLNKITDENDDEVRRGRLALSGSVGYFILKRWEISGRVNVPVSNKFYSIDGQLGINFHF